MADEGGAGRRRWTRRRFRRPTRRRTVVLVLIGVLLLGFTLISARLFVWPDLAPVPEHVDAIVELAGPADGGRDALAERLAREHRAPVLIQSTTTAEAGTHTCLAAPPGVTVLCFHPVPATTRGEAEYLGRLAAGRGWRSIVLVTTPDQAWRARLRVGRCFPGQVYVATSSLPWYLYFRQVPYQWAASVKAVVWERAC